MTMTPHTAIKPVIGGRYNWRNQPERLIYMGVKSYPGNGLGYQFAKVEAPDVCWSEVRFADLEFFEDTK